MKLTDLMIENYLEDPNCCPYCGSEDIRSFGEKDWTTDTASREIACNMCKARWYEHFKLVHISGLEIENELI